MLLITVASSAAWCWDVCWSRTTDSFGTTGKVESTDLATSSRTK